MQSLDPLFRPQSIAIIGASTRPLTIGNRIVTNLLEYGFKGPLYPVNPKAAPVLDQTAYPSIGEVPGPVDLAHVIVKNTLVAQTLEACAEKGVKVAVGRFPFVANGKALILEETGGFIKFVSDAATGEVLGVHIVGPHATDLIAEAALCMKMEGTVEEINATIHAHPTIAEAVLEASLDTVGAAVHIPPKRGR